MVPTVLVIDDDAGVRAVVRRALGLAGMATVEAENGRRGLEVVGTGDPAVDLVVTDVDMPEVDGIEVATILARYRPELPVVYLTGINSPRSESDLRALGAPILWKPCSPELLTATVLRTMVHAAALHRDALGTRASAHGAAAVADAARGESAELRMRSAATRDETATLVRAARELHAARQLRRGG